MSQSSLFHQLIKLGMAHISNATHHVKGRIGSGEKCFEGFDIWLPFRSHYMDHINIFRSLSLMSIHVTVKLNSAKWFQMICLEIMPDGILSAHRYF